MRTPASFPSFTIAVASLLNLFGADLFAAGNLSQEAYIKASNPDSNDFFSSVAMSGNTLVVGAAWEDSAATGINGNQLDNSSTNSGAVYVFVRDGVGWSQQAYLKASNPDNDDYFGSVAISGDTLVVGSPGEDSNARGVNGDQSNNSGTNSGAAYVFVRSGTNWTQQAYLKPSNTEFGERFGTGVAIDGDTIVVGAWIESSGSPGVNGDENDNSVPAAGAAYVFVRNGTNWTQQAYLKASNPGTNDYFGITVAVWGDTIAIGAVFEDSGSPGINGNQMDNSVTNAGAVYVFVRDGGIWTQQAYIKASNPGSDYFPFLLFGDEFGGSLALQGNTLVVGARNESSNATGVNGDQNNNSGFGSGAAYVFVRDGTNWSQEAYLKANTYPRDFAYFGKSVALASPDLIIIGAEAEDSDTTGINGPATNTGAVDSGAAYVFERFAGSWSQIAYVKASNTGTSDLFGGTVAGSGNILAVSAAYEASNANGVNGNQLDNSLSGSGAVYVFQIAPEPPALAITSTGPTTAIISWPSPSAGWSLEENATFSGGIWTTPAETISDDGTDKFIVIGTTNVSRFFRLAQ